MFGRLSIVLLCSLCLATTIGTRTLATPAVPSGNSGAKAPLPLNQYSQQYWYARDGLPAEPVKDVVQTPDGYVWGATQEGLARFDGVRFEVFDTRNSPGLASDNIHQLVVDGSGVLWILAGNGLSSYAHGRFETAIKPNLPNLDIVQKLWIGPDRQLMAASRFALWEASGRTVRVLMSFRGMGVNETGYGEPQCGPDGTLAIMRYDRGLIVIRNGHQRQYPNAGLLKRSDEYSGQTVDEHGDVWVGAEAGLVRISGATIKLMASRNNLDNGAIDDLRADHFGHIWLLVKRTLYCWSNG